MNEEGYTLVEALLALLVIGLAIGGLTEGMRSAGRLQGAASKALADDRSASAIREGLGQLIESEGPFPSDQADVFQGSVNGFRFDCDAKAACGAWLTSAEDGLELHIAGRGGIIRTFILHGVTAARFSYAGSRTIGGAWPATSKELQTLKSIGLVAQTAVGDIPITSARVWLEQTPGCDFDAIIQTCRTTTQ
jgi:hypothetical protein